MYSEIRNKINKMFFEKKLIDKTYKIESGYAQGLNLLLNDEYYNRYIKSGYENFIIEKITELQKDRKINCIFDIGGHIGFTSLCIASNCETISKIHVFEPNKNNIKFIEHNLQLNPQFSSKIDLHKMAISDKTGILTFFQSQKENDTTTMGGYLENTLPPLEKSVYQNFLKEQVVCSTIDSLVNEHKIYPELLKIDVEGAEYSVLKGGESYIKEYKPLILVEIHGVVQMFKTNNFLIGLGYKQTIIDEKNALPYNCYLLCEPN